MTRAPLLRPLREDSSLDDPELMLGAKLLERVGPSMRSEHRKRRVWNALSVGTASGLGVRLRTLHLAFAALLVAAAAGATVGGYYVTQRVPDAAPPPPAPPAAAPRAKSPAAARAPRQLEAVAAAPASSPATAPPAPTAPRTKVESAAPAARAPSEAEAQLLVEAMRARRGGDSKRVGELVEQYRAKHPQGTLQEEALILAIESAAARRRPNTSALAREYLSRFPQGRFAPQARRALSLEAR